MLYLVPLACTRREMADTDCNAGFIRQFLQLQLPQMQARAIAAAGVCRDQ
jgi:hypothetical protein